MSRYAIHLLRGERYSSYPLFTSVLDGGEWSASWPGRALPRGKEFRYQLLTFQQESDVLFKRQAYRFGDDSASYDCVYVHIFFYVGSQLLCSPQEVGFHLGNWGS
jgi:hypothetical protein